MTLTHPTIVSLLELKEKCGTQGLKAPAEAPGLHNPAMTRRGRRRPAPKSCVLTSGIGSCSTPAALKLSTGGAERNARSDCLHNILCPHRALRHRPPHGLFRYVPSRPRHHAVCDAANLAAHQPIAPCWMAPPGLMDFVLSHPASTSVAKPAALACKRVNGKTLSLCPS